tara:strand:+ start:1140 stop:1334 length:195 start_codon:yes stop_codon:yes gene_type:complete
MTKNPSIKLEKITLWTSTDAFGATMELESALDELLAALSRCDIETKILAYDSEELELVTKKTNE